MKKLRVLDLFSGIGGFSLGLERAGGFETVAFCEIEDYPRRVLAKHWPGVPCYDDVRNLTADRLAADGIAVDVICGGFPCQDLSAAGNRAGMDGTRSGLWSEIARLVGELRPRFCIVENVAGLLSGPSEQPGRWFGRVLGDLAALGYDAEWNCIPASAIGAHHRRDRVWLVAYPDEIGSRQVGKYADSGDGWPDADDLGSRRRDPSQMANTEQSGLEGHDRAELAPRGRPRLSIDIRAGRACFESSQWGFEPELGRVADGVSNRVDRIAALGNAVVPQIPELIGRAIMQAEGMSP